MRKPKPKLKLKPKRKISPAEAARRKHQSEAATGVTWRPSRPGGPNDLKFTPAGKGAYRIYPQ